MTWKILRVIFAMYMINMAMWVFIAYYRGEPWTRECKELPITYIMWLEHGGK